MLCHVLLDQGAHWAAWSGVPTQLCRPSFPQPWSLRPQAPEQVPAKQRLAALAGALRRSTGSRGRACKVVVFMSSCDAVEFAHQLLGQDGPLGGAGADVPLLDCPLWKLHGNMVQVRQHPALSQQSRAWQLAGEGLRGG